MQHRDWDFPSAAPSSSMNPSGAPSFSSLPTLSSPPRSSSIPSSTPSISLAPSFSLFHGSPSYCTLLNLYGQCQGDCQNDAECLGDLVCHQRNEGDPGPLGCGGIPINNVDCCGDLQPGPSAAPSLSSSPTIDGLKVTIEIQTDLFGSETSWTTVQSGSVVASGGGLRENELYVIHERLPYGCYEFVIRLLE